MNINYMAASDFIPSQFMFVMHHKYYDLRIINIIKVMIGFQLKMHELALSSDLLSWVFPGELHNHFVFPHHRAADT